MKIVELKASVMDILYICHVKGPTKNNKLGQS